MVEYTPVTAVWEVTMACNMQCMHCGSACSSKLPEELTTEEALNLCDEIGLLGLSWLTLSGGEPLTRTDWPLIAQRLRSHGVVPNMITNGWLITQDTVDKMIDSGIGTVAISLDGVRETHDKIRCEGSFDRDMKAFELMHKSGQYTGAITSVSKKNIKELPDIYNILVEHNVDAWQLQICIPMGNMKEHKDELIDAEEVDYLLDFCLKVAREGKIIVYPADCLGYFTEKEDEIRQISFGNNNVLWAGCNAGKRGFGILHNGDILGCTSIRDRSFIEGNVREKSLYDIWHNKESFAWSREMKREQLGGFCKECRYGDDCLGGCPNTRLTINGTMESESPYCAYLNASRKLQQDFARQQRSSADYQRALTMSQDGRLQEASLLLTEMLNTNPKDIEALALQGYVHFFLGDYETAKKSNEVILELEPEHWYANKGLGLSLHKLGNTGEGIRLLKKAIDYCPEHIADPQVDLAYVYQEIGKHEEANKLLQNVNA